MSLLRLVVGLFAMAVYYVATAIEFLRDARRPKRYEICTVSFYTGRVTHIPGDPMYADTEIMFPGAEL